MICLKPGRSSFNAGSQAGAVRCEFRDAGMQWPVWDTFAAVGSLARLKVLVIAPSDVKEVLDQKSCSSLVEGRAH